jgi:hypothetical protein
MRPVKTLSLCCALLLVTVSTQSVAETKTVEVKAREAFVDAQKLYSAGKYADALKRFREAEALKAHPVITFNIALCLDKLGEVKGAIDAYREYLRLSPQATDRDAVQRAIAALEPKLPVQLPSFIVTADPATAEVRVDGKKLSGTPTSTPLAAGEHTLEVSAVGYENLKRSFTMPAGRALEMNLSLKAKAASTPVVTTPPPEKKDPVVVATDVPKREPTLTPEPTPTDLGSTLTPEPAPKKRVATWVVGGVAVAAAGTATAFGLVALNRETTLHLPVDLRPKFPSATALATDAQGFATAANVTWAVAGTAAITAVVLFFVEK